MHVYTYVLAHTQSWIHQWIWLLPPQRQACMHGYVYFLCCICMHTYILIHTWMSLTAPSSAPRGYPSKRRPNCTDTQTISKQHTCIYAKSWDMAYSRVKPIKKEYYIYTQTNMSHKAHLQSHANRGGCNYRGCCCQMWLHHPGHEPIHTRHVYTMTWHIKHSCIITANAHAECQYTAMRIFLLTHSHAYNTHTQTSRRKNKCTCTHPHRRANRGGCSILKVATPPNRKPADKAAFKTTLAPCIYDGSMYVCMYVYGFKKTAYRAWRFDLSGIYAYIWE